jgi:hypothetical protein
LLRLCNILIVHHIVLSPISIFQYGRNYCFLLLSSLGLSA